MQRESLFTVVLLASASIAQAAFIDPGLTGNTQYDGWVGLTANNYPGYGSFPGNGAWPAPIISNTPGSGDASLRKVSNGPGGGPYLAGSSIYFGGFSAEVNYDGGTLAVGDTTVVDNLSNVVFQIEIGEAWTYDFYNRQLPVLSFNGGGQQLAATVSILVDQVYNGTVDMPTGPEDVYINSWLVQWDLSAYAGITDFEISFTGVQHAQLYSLRLDQSDVYAAVPAPASLALLSLGGLVATRRRR